MTKSFYYTNEIPVLYSFTRILSPISHAISGLKFNQTISPRKRLKLSFFKKVDMYKENDDDSNQTVETTAIDDSMKKYYELMGEHTNTICD